MYNQFVKYPLSFSNVSDKPVYSNTYQLPRSCFSNASIWAGIDFGCSLLKVAYVLKKDALDEKVDPVTIHCCSYKASQFDDMLKLLKENVHFPSGVVLRVTGVGCTHREAKIKEYLGVPGIVFVQEFVASCRGLYILLQHSKRDTVLYEKAEKSSETDIIIPEEMKIMFESMKSKYTKNDPTDGSHFPALFMIVGSGCGTFFVNSEGKVRMATGIPSAGKMFLGLSRLLLGTCDYDEIVSKAALGNRVNTDLVVGDMIADDPNSPYGQFPPDTPIMPFAKAVDQDRGLESFSQEDIAAGMVGLLCSQFFFFSMSAAECFGVSRIYVGGGFCRSETVRKEWQKTSDSMFKGLLEFEFVRSEHTGAIGTMLTKPEDLPQLMLM